MSEHFYICWPPALTNLFCCHHKTNPFPNIGQELPADEFLSYSLWIFLKIEFQTSHPYINAHN
jgi:hypothetical protein